MRSEVVEVKHIKTTPGGIVDVVIKNSNIVQDIGRWLLRCMHAHCTITASRIWSIAFSSVLMTEQEGCPLEFVKSFQVPTS